MFFVYFVSSQNKKNVMIFPYMIPFVKLDTHKNGVISALEVIRISAYRTYEKLSGDRKKNLYFIFYVNLGICHIEYFMCIIFHIQKQSIVFIMFPSGTPEPLFTSIFLDYPSL